MLEVRNMIACDAISAEEPYTLTSVRFAWSRPPSEFALWCDIGNPSERAFSVQLQVYRLKELVFTSDEELVLSGLEGFQKYYRFVAGALQVKTYAFRLLLNGVPARTLVLDFGAREA